MDSGAGNLVDHSCICCDNLAGFHAVMYLDDTGVHYICPGCAVPRHRYLTYDLRYADHMNPDWVASRMTHPEANQFIGAR